MLLCYVVCPNFILPVHKQVESFSRKTGATISMRRRVLGIVLGYTASMPLVRRVMDVVRGSEVDEGGCGWIQQQQQQNGDGCNVSRETGASRGARHEHVTLEA